MKGIVDIELRFVPSVARPTGDDPRRVVKRLQWRKLFCGDDGALTWTPWENVPMYRGTVDMKPE